MAESNLLAPIFRTAIGWLSDDIFNGIDWSFYSAKNINIRDNAKGISLNKALVKDSWTVITEKINAIFKTSTGKMMAFGASWGIYRKDTTTWAKITTDSPATEIFSAIEFNWYIYWTTSDYLHRLAIGDLSSNISAKDVINRQALTSAIYHPMLSSMWDLYVGHWGKIGVVDSTNVWSDLITMDSVWVVKKLNDLWWSIRVVTTPSVWNSNIYLWDWINKEPDQTIPLKWFDIRQSEIFNGYNYLVTNKWIGILDGYKIYPIRNITTFNDNINSIAVHNEKLCIWGIGWVYTFWAKNKNYPEVLNLDYSTSAGLALDEIGAIYSDWVDLYVSWKSTALATPFTVTYGIDKLSTTTYYTSGELETRGYYGRSLYEIKETIRALVGFKALLANETLTISYSVDWWAYTSLWTFTSATVLSDLFTEDLLFSSGSFQYIQFKISLVWPWTTTPEFYNLDLVFNGNIKR